MLDCADLPRYHAMQSKTKFQYFFYRILSIANMRSYAFYILHLLYEMDNFIALYLVLGIVRI